MGGLGLRGKESPAPAEEALLAATESLSREELIAWLGDAAKLWLAHDGLWFQAVERARGIDEAVTRDEEAMAGWTSLEGRRVVERLGLAPNGGLEDLEKALRGRLYVLLNRQEIIREPDRLIFTMKTCRVQDARRRRGLTPFSCKSVGLIEYAGFAAAVDPRLRVSCRHCPPDKLPEGSWCSWEFRLSQD